MEKCKYCEYEGYMQFYVKFFETDYLNELSSLNKNAPKFGFHYGSECPKCGRWQRWETQDQEITKRKFYER